MTSAFEAPGEWFRGNLHLHTTVSDGDLEPQEAVDGYRAQGYDFLAITDHDRVVEVEELEDRGMTLLPGVEIAPPGGELGQTIHCVGIGASEAPERREGDTAQDAIGRLNDLCEATFVAHPSWSSLTFADILPIEGIIGVEVFNFTCHRGIGRGLSEVQWDDLLARGRRLFGLGVDDAHFHYDDLYGGWIVLKAEEPTREAIYEALRQGRFYASQGPTIESVEIEGDTVHVECSPVMECLAVCPTAGRGWTNWRQESRRDVHSEFEFELRPGTDPIRICVVDQEGRRAWTNPWWKDGEEG